MYPYWISLVTISLSLSLVAFVWALRDGQFSDQGRARYLPLSDEFPQQPVKHPSKLTLEAYVLLSIVVLGSLGIIGSLVLSLWRFEKG
jgi:cbb3-type cytochrome oxidase maturation protein